MSNDVFMGIVLKQRKILHEKLAKEKTLRQRQERTEQNALAILEAEAAGGNATKIKATDLTILLSWHQHPKVAGMKKEENEARGWPLSTVGKRRRRSRNGLMPTM